MEQAQVQQGEAATDPLLRMAERSRVKAASQGAAFQGAMSQAFGRMCAGYPGVRGAILQLAQRRVSLAELVDLVEPGMFLGLLEGAGDTTGMVWLSPSTLEALVEAQTTGQVMPIAQGKTHTRLPTRTDAALMAPMIDSFLQQITHRCADLPEASIVNGFVYGSFLDDRRPIGTVLEDIEYEMITLQLTLAQGRVAGTWTLVFPHPARVCEEPAQLHDDWENQMQNVVKNSPVNLNAVLCRFKLTLNEALGLKAGDVLRVPDSALETLALSALGGTPLALGRLGQARGFRALRLTSDPGAGAQDNSYSPPTLRLSLAMVTDPQPYAVNLTNAPKDTYEHTDKAAQHS